LKGPLLLIIVPDIVSASGDVFLMLVRDQSVQAKIMSNLPHNNWNKIQGVIWGPILAELNIL